jgi:hypothetical protein
MEKLIIKYLTDTLDIEENERLMKWLEKEKNQDRFCHYVKENVDLDLYHFKDMSGEVFNKILERNKVSKRKKVIRLNTLFKYAAAIILLVTTGYYLVLNNQHVEKSEIVVIDNDIPIGIDKATLTLEDGSNIVLEKGQGYTSNNLESNGEEIIYNSKANAKEEIKYNYLTIPRGGEFFIELADNTKVWLNSESKIKYPINFIEGKTREVELVYGEAYFDVSPSTEHKGSKFKVQTGIQEVQVLGTEFNIKAYKDEEAIYTTLVEGKVSVKNASNENKLSPNQQSIINIGTGEVQIDEIDVNDEIGWVKGGFIFKRKSLEDIMKVLSRWYDVDVEFEYSMLKTLHFTGDLKRYETINTHLEMIELTTNVKFEINENTVYVKNK